MIINDFNKYLDSLKLTEKSRKYYMSDINHFVSWSVRKLNEAGYAAYSLDDIIPYIDGVLGNGYKSFLIQTNTPVKTANRKLSTIRHLSHFFRINRICNFDFMTDVANIGLNLNKSPFESLTNQFVNHLRSQKTSENTIKGYQNDIKQFFSWVESQ